VDEYKIKCKLGKPVSKKIPWKNEEKTLMSYQLLSSDEEIMQVKIDQVELKAGESTHFKIKILPGDMVGENTVYLLVHDNIGTKMCIILNVIYE